MSKQEWKKTGVELGHAFKSVGKGFAKSAVTVADKATEWAETEEEKKQENNEKSNAFKDGTWRNASKEMGHAIKDLGKTIVRTARPSGKSTNESTETGANDIEVESVKNSDEQ